MSSTADYKPPPQWLSEGDVSDSSHDAGATSSHGLTSAGGAQRTRNSSASTKKILQYKTHIMWALKICTVVFSSLMLFTALYGLSGMRGVGEINRVFVGVYMLCFSIMLITFEVIQLQPVEALDHMYQRNFGFLYGVKGKGLFIIFVAFLSFGLGSDTLCVMSGLSLMALGAAMVGLFLKYPDLFDESTN